MDGVLTPARRVLRRPASPKRIQPSNSAAPGLECKVGESFSAWQKMPLSPTFLADSVGRLRAHSSPASRPPAQRRHREAPSLPTFLRSSSTRWACARQATRGVSCACPTTTAVAQGRRAARRSSALRRRGRGGRAEFVALSYQTRLLPSRRRTSRSSRVGRPQARTLALTVGGKLAAERSSSSGRARTSRPDSLTGALPVAAPRCSRAWDRADRPGCRIWHTRSARPH